MLIKRSQQARTSKNCGSGNKRLHSEVKFKVTCRGPAAEPTSNSQSIFGWLSAQSLAGGQTKKRRQMSPVEARVFFRGGSTSSHVKPSAAAVGFGRHLSPCVRQVKVYYKRQSQNHRHSKVARWAAGEQVFLLPFANAARPREPPARQICISEASWGLPVEAARTRAHPAKNWMHFLHFSLPRCCPSGQEEWQNMNVVTRVGWAVIAYKYLWAELQWRRQIQLIIEWKKKNVQVKSRTKDE